MILINQAKVFKQEKNFPDSSTFKFGNTTVDEKRVRTACTTRMDKTGCSSGPQLKGEPEKSYIKRDSFRTLRGGRD